MQEAESKEDIVVENFGTGEIIQNPKIQQKETTTITVLSKQDPSPPFEKFIHSMIISTLIGILLAFSLFNVFFFAFFKTNDDPVFKIGIMIIALIVIISFTVSYIMYCNNIINIDGTYKVGDYSKTICGENIYILDTGEYKVSEGITGFSSNNLGNNSLIKSYFTSTPTIFILIIAYVYVLIKGYINANDENIFEGGQCSNDIDNSALIGCESLGKRNIKIFLVIVYLLFSIFGGEIKSLIKTHNLSILNIKDIQLTKLYLFNLLVAFVILTIPLYTFSNDKHQGGIGAFVGRIFYIIKYFCYNMIKLALTFITDKMLLKYILAIFILIIFNRTLTKIITNSNAKILTTINNDWLDKYIISTGVSNINNINNAESPYLTTILDNLPLFNHGTGTNIAYNEIDNAFIDYFQENIKNAYINSENPIFGADPLMLRDYKDNLFKFVQFNRGNEFDTIIPSIQDYVNNKKLDLSTSSYASLFDQLGINSSPYPNSSINIDSIEKDLIYYINAITNIRKICFNMRNDKSLKNYIASTSKHLVMITIVILSVSMYLFIHQLIKLDYNAISYIVFFIIIFAVLMAGYGWATGFTYT